MNDFFLFEEKRRVQYVEAWWAALKLHLLINFRKRQDISYSTSLLDLENRLDW
jgi:hypothetical protein